MHNTDRMEYCRGTLMWCILYNNWDPTKIFDQLFKAKKMAVKQLVGIFFCGLYKERCGKYVWAYTLCDEQESTMVASVVFEIRFHTQFPWIFAGFHILPLDFYLVACTSLMHVCNTFSVICLRWAKRKKQSSHWRYYVTQQYFHHFHQCVFSIFFFFFSFSPWSHAACFFFCTKSQVV